MEIENATKLMKKYISCPDCGNRYIGNGEGKLIINDDSFVRTCKCGFQVKIMESDIEDDGECVKV